MKIEGRNAVLELLKTDTTIDKILIQNGADVSNIVERAKAKNIRIQYVNKEAMNDQSVTKKHQGVIAFSTDFKYSDLEDILKYAKERKEELLIIFLDKIEDPHNLGSIVRVAECVGAHGIVIPKYHSATVNETVIKTSAGATARVKIAKVNNLAQAIDYVKEKNVFVYAADMNGSPMYKTDLKGDIGVIIGSEGNGISELTRKKADGVISIPMYGKINSLNASVSAGIVLYEAVRQRKFKN